MLPSLSLHGEKSRLYLNWARDAELLWVPAADFIPGRVGLQIFQAMPASIRCQAILAALTGKGAAMPLIL